MPMKPEHTCAGMYDLSCEACWEERLEEEARREELPGERRDYWSYDEPCEWDVIGGL